MSMPTPHVNEDTMEDVCPICHDSLSDSQGHGMPTIIPCGHIFHVRCIEEVARHTSTCPECRQHFTIPGIEPAPNKENVNPNVGCAETAKQEKITSNTVAKIYL